MKCTVVTTHPLTNSLCKRLTEQVTEQLEAMGHEVTLEDLYTQNFAPALTATERATYYSKQYDSSNVIDHASQLKRTEALVLLFPTWWYGFPAILKGWFDRVWGPGVAYDHAADLGAIQPRLVNLKEVLVVTTLGSPWWVDWLIMRRPVKRVVKIALLGTCTRKNRLQFLSLYKSEKLDEQRITKFSKRIEQALLRWKT